MESKLAKQNEIPFGVDFIHFIYQMFGIIGSVILVLILSRVDLFGWERWITFLLSMICIWTINYGISNRKGWLVHLLLIYAAWSFVLSLFWIVSQRQISAYALTMKCFHLLLAIFYGFQIQIFSRKNTRQFFNHKGKVLFS